VGVPRESTMPVPPRSLKVVVLSGVPACGKSSLALGLIKKCGESPTQFTYRLLRGQVYSKSKIILFGLYEDEAKLGLDCYSHAAQPQLLKAIAALAQSNLKPHFRVFMEGDRVGSLQCLTKMGSITNVNLHVFVVKVESQVWQERLAQREAKRGSPYNSTWLRTTQSKIQNIDNNLKKKTTRSSTSHIEQHNP